MSKVNSKSYPTSIGTLHHTWALAHEREYVRVVHAIALNTLVAPFGETMGIFHIFHPFVEVDFPPFVDDFHLKTKVTLDQKTFISTHSPHLYSNGPSSMVYQLLRNCFVPIDSTSGFDLFFKICGHIVRGHV
jgi:hypothetical protein